MLGSRGTRTLSWLVLSLLLLLSVACKAHDKAADAVDDAKK